MGILSVVLFSSSFTLVSQSIQHLILPTNYVGGDSINLIPIIGSKTYLEGDTNLILQDFITSDSSNLAVKQEVLEVEFGSLSLQNRTTNWSKGKEIIIKNQFGEYGIINTINKDKVTGANYFFELRRPHIDTVVFNLYAVKTNFQKDSLLFQSLFVNQSILSVPYIENGECFVILHNFQTGIGEIQKFDLTGALKVSRLIDYNNFNLSVDFSIDRYQLVEQSPLGNDKFQLTSFALREVVTLNKSDLSTVNRIGITSTIGAQLYSNYGFAGPVSSTQISDTSGIIIGGSCRILLANNTFDWQYYKCHLGWDSSVISFESFGDTTKLERAVSYQRVGNRDLFIATTDVPLVNLPYSATYRQTIVLLKTQNNIDSIRLFGSKNHLIRSVVSNSLDDLLLTSYFSNAWSDDSIFLQLTKIPIGILTSIREQELSRNVAIYPNPTRDFIYSDEFENGDVVQIFNQQGQLLKEERISFSNGIDVRFLRTGTYFFQLIRENKRQTVLFVKTE